MIYAVIKLSEKRYGVAKKVMNGYYLMATCTNERYAAEIVTKLNKGESGEQMA